MKIHELFAYLHVKGAAKAIEFYTQVFGAKEKFRKWPDRSRRARLRR